MITEPSIALLYLTRFADQDWEAKLLRFIESYKICPPGIGHALYIVYKGFSRKEYVDRVREVCSLVPHASIPLEDKGFDIGSYALAAAMLKEDTLCFLNAHSKLICGQWLLKMYLNFCRPRVGVVSATGSFESLSSAYADFPEFPNPHIRTNGFMLSRRLAIELFGSVNIETKFDAYMFESGPEGMTRRLLAAGLQPLIIGANGRGYGIQFWPYSGTFQQFEQENLLIDDNVTELYRNCSYEDKLKRSKDSWGGAAQEDLYRLGLGY